jgi:Fe(3+) dicitrate transport protein
MVAFLVALGSPVVAHAQPNESPSADEPAPPPEGTPPAGSEAEPQPEPPAPPAAPETSSQEAAEPAGSSQTPDVTVAGTRVEHTAGSAHVISNRKLERTEYDDPQAVLQMVPGVYARGEDGLGLRPNIGIRGANPNRSSKVALMEDGVPFGPAPYSAPAAYYFPLMTRMYQVRVIKGPGTIVYGPQTVGGSVDLITRPIPASPSGSVDLAVGAYGYGKFHGWYGASNETDGFLLEAVHLRDDGFKELPDHSDTGFYRNEWMVKAAHNFDPSSERKNEIAIKATYSEEDSHETYLGLTDADFRADPLQRYAGSQMDEMRWNRTAVALTHVLEPMREMKITTTVYRNDFHRIWNRLKGVSGAGGEGGLFDLLLHPETNPHLVNVLRGTEDSSGPGGPDVLLWGPNDREFVSQGIQTVISLSPKTGPVEHRIEYGVRLHYDRVERRQSEDGYLMINGKMVPEGTATVVTEYNEAATESAALYVLDALTWKTLTLTPGARIEFWHATGTDKKTDAAAGGTAQVVLPGIGAYWSITDELGLLGGAYRGFSPPPPPLPSEETVGTAAEEKPGLKEPELSINYEGGVRYTKYPTRLEAIGFYNDYSNLTDVCTASSGCLGQSLDRQFDAGRAKIYGLEAYAEHEPSLGSAHFPLSVAYTLTFAQFLDSFSSSDPMWGDVDPGDELPYVPRHQLNAQAGVEVDRVGGYAAFTYIAEMREEAGSEPMKEALKTDEQAILDIGAHYRVLDPLELYANVRNVFDSHDLVARRPFGARPNAPRWIQVGAKVKF